MSGVLGLETSNFGLISVQTGEKRWKHVFWTKNVINEIFDNLSYVVISATFCYIFQNLMCKVQNCRSTQSDKYQNLAGFEVNVDKNLRKKMMEKHAYVVMLKKSSRYET